MVSITLCLCSVSIRHKWLLTILNLIKVCSILHTELFNKTNSLWSRNPSMVISQPKVGNTDTFTYTLDMGNTNIFYEFLCFDFFRVSLLILLRPLRPRLTQHDRFAGFSQIRPPQAGVFQKEATSRRFHEKCVFCKESKENSRCDWCWIQWPTDDWRDIQKGRNQLHDRERVTRPHHHLRRRHVVVLLRGAPHHSTNMDSTAVEQSATVRVASTKLVNVA